MGGIHGGGCIVGLHRGGAAWGGLHGGGDAWGVLYGGGMHGGAACGGLHGGGDAWGVCRAAAHPGDVGHAVDGHLLLAVQPFAVLDGPATRGGGGGMLLHCACMDHQQLDVAALQHAHIWTLAQLDVMATLTPGPQHSWISVLYSHLGHSPTGFGCHTDIWTPAQLDSTHLTQSTAGLHMSGPQHIWMLWPHLHLGPSTAGLHTSGPRHSWISMPRSHVDPGTAGCHGHTHTWAPAQLDCKHLGHGTAGFQCHNHIWAIAQLDLDATLTSGPQHSWIAHIWTPAQLDCTHVGPSTAGY